MQGTAGLTVWRRWTCRLQAATLQQAHELGRGLHEEHMATLKRVLNVGRLPGSDSAARLFTDSRILAVPPDEAPEPVGQRFRVHPLLEAWVRDAKG